MAYTPYEWRDGEEGGTPITAERLNHIENGIGHHTHSAEDITSGTLDAERLPEIAAKAVAVDEIPQHEYQGLDNVQDILEGIAADIELLKNEVFPA